MMRCGCTSQEGEGVIGVRIDNSELQKVEQHDETDREGSYAGDLGGEEDRAGKWVHLLCVCCSGGR